MQGVVGGELHIKLVMRTAVEVLTTPAGKAKRVVAAASDKPWLPSDGQDVGRGWRAGDDEQSQAEVRTDFRNWSWRGQAPTVTAHIWPGL